MFVVSILLLNYSLLMISPAADGHLLMVTTSRGSRAAVSGLERRDADPHSMAFSWGRRYTCNITFNNLIHTHMHTHMHCLTSGWKGWHDSGFFLSFWNFSLSHFSDSLCSKESRLHDAVTFRAQPITAHLSWCKTLVVSNTLMINVRVSQLLGQGLLWCYEQF